MPKHVTWSWIARSRRAARSTPRMISWLAKIVRSHRTLRRWREFPEGRDTACRELPGEPLLADEASQLGVVHLGGLVRWLR
jgi:hypothetical protein